MLRSVIAVWVLWMGCASAALAGGKRDTVLVSVPNLGYPVNSVFNGEEGGVFLTGAKGLERRIESGEFEVVDQLQTTPVFWTGSELVDGSEWSALRDEDPFMSGRVWRDYFGRVEMYSRGAHRLDPFAGVRWVSALRAGISHERGGVSGGGEHSGISMVGGRIGGQFVQWRLPRRRAVVGFGLQ